MSRLIQTLILNYQTLKTVTEDDWVAIKVDFERAINNVSLTEEERLVVEQLMYADPDYPERTGLPGRPKGGITQSSLADLIPGADGKTSNARVTRRLQSAAQKLARYLGTGYDESNE